MSRPAELFDRLPLDFDSTRVETRDRPISARRAIAVWVGLSVGGWGVLAAALLSLASF
jgi:hypothetical protein